MSDFISASAGIFIVASHGTASPDLAQKICAALIKVIGSKPEQSLSSDWWRQCIGKVPGQASSNSSNSKLTATSGTLASKLGTWLGPTTAEAAVITKYIAEMRGLDHLLTLSIAMQTDDTITLDLGNMTITRQGRDGGLNVEIAHEQSVIALTDAILPELEKVFGTFTLDTGQPFVFTVSEPVASLETAHAGALT
ncbi:MAG: hypothetical protein AAF891_06580 [Pseudomonadota bacterium]